MVWAKALWGMQRVRESFLGIHRGIELHNGSGVQDLKLRA